MEQDASKWYSIVFHIYCTDLKEHLKFLLDKMVYPDCIYITVAAPKRMNDKLKAGYWLWEGNI